jgi:ribosomal-protein-alanine N-acetyltransferase
MSPCAINPRERQHMLPELQTERLVLREVRLEDGPALQAFQSRPEQWQRMAMEPEEFADGTLRVQRYFEHRGPDSGRRLFVYVAHERSFGVLVGQVSFSRSHPALASLGFSVATEYWNKGYAAEMATRLIEFGFDEIGLHRVSADVAIENEASKRVLDKIGMTYEGTARDCIWAQGRWWTESQYAILVDDYRANRRTAVRRCCGNRRTAGSDSSPIARW